MTFSAVYLGSPQWLVPVVSVAVVLIALIVGSYRRSTRASLGLLLAAVLKAIAVLLVAVCLLDPLQSGVRPRPGANIFAILVDDSRSMSIAGRGLPAGADIQQWLGRESDAWRARLAQDFDVRAYAFSEAMSRIEDASQLTAAGSASNLSTALAGLKDQFGDRPIAGVLLLTDGNRTDGDGSVLELLPNCPVYPVLGPTSPVPADVRWDNVQRSQSYFETSPTTINADLVATDCAGARVVAQLVDSQQKVVEEQAFSIEQREQRVAVRFRFRPEDPGLTFYRIRTFLEQERELFADQRSNVEATVENNQRTVVVDRGGGPFRLLYVSGRPNWEFKFLRRALAADEELNLVGLMRIANKEPKFQYQDRQSGTNTNPLFQGFENERPEVDETYDQPVMVRINVQDDQELAEGFPATAAAMFRYDAIIVDDLEAAFFSPDQMLLLREYVSRRGGSLLMLGGLSSFQQGGYAKTPLGEMLPVYLTRGVETGPISPVSLQLTREGLLETWTRLRATELEEQQRTAEMPAFRTLSNAQEIKPGALRVAEAVAGDIAYPAVVTQRFGKGRTAAFLVGDLWQWSLARPDVERDDLAMFWRQAMRWLVAETPRHTELDVQRPESSDGRVQLTASVRSPEFLADDDATVEFTVTAPDGVQHTISGDAGVDEPGQYIADFWATDSGGYRVEAKVVTHDNDVQLPRPAGWVQAPEESEFQELAVQREFLQELAQRTAGECVDPAKMQAFVEQLPNRRVPVSEPWVAPLWHQAWIFACAVGCLCAEWGLRRWKGLS